MKKKFVKGLQDVVAAESSISKIDGDQGRLIYRGYTIEELAGKSNFEEVIHLLWFGELPNKIELRNFKAKLFSQMRLPELKFKLSKSHMTSIRTGVSVLSSYDNDADNIATDINRDKAISIMAKMPAMVAAIYRKSKGKKPIKPKKGLSFAANFLYMLNGKLPSIEQEKVFDVCLILHAEHGLNASTFAARVTVGTLSDMYSGIVSAIGTLKGPLHGGANIRAIENLHGLAKNLHVKDFCTGSCLNDVDKYVKKMLRDHIKIMGIGHRVYKVKDPRANILEKYACGLGKKYIKYYQIAKEIEKVMEEERGLYPNVDFFSGMVYEDLGIPTSLYVCVFALSRTAGWIAHMMEQYQDNRLIRPRAVYVGKLNRKYKNR